MDDSDIHCFISKYINIVRSNVPGDSTFEAVVEDVDAERSTYLYSRSNLNILS